MRFPTLIIAFALALSLSSPGTAWGADFEKGLAAWLKEDYATALQKWEPLAEQGHADAQFQLGNAYYLGQGVPQNYEEAAKWLRLAAEQGTAPLNSFWEVRIILDTALFKIISTPTCGSIFRRQAGMRRRLS